MAEMEGIEQESHEEEKKGIVKEEMGEEGGVSEEEVLELWYKVSKEVTLHQPELCAIYTAVHWAWKPDGSPWNDVEIKQIVGHATLGLDEDKYHHLDLTDVIKQFYIEDNDLTKAAKSIAERLKKMLVAWIPQQHEKYLNMCRKDKKSVSPVRSVTISQLIGRLGWPNCETMKYSLIKSNSKPQIKNCLRKDAVLRNPGCMDRSPQCRQYHLIEAVIVRELQV